MYALNPKSARDFIDDKAITLPRFQRKQTWNERKNFRLALSLFKGYPLGMIILHVVTEPDERGREQTQKFLLDGRQRRNALTLMENPEELWSWAKRTLRIGDPETGKQKRLSTRTTTEQLAEAFWSEIDDYFGVEDWEEPYTDSLYDDADEAEEMEQPSVETESATDEHHDAVPTDGLTFGLTPPTESLHEAHPYASAGLNDLLQLLVLVHPVTKRSSGLREAFDLSSHLDGLPYVRPGDAERMEVKTDRLLVWLSTLQSELQFESISYPPTLEELVAWLQANYEVTTSAPKLEKSVQQKWQRISGFFEVLSRIDQRLRDATIGYLEIDNVGANDEKKIFEIINTEGEKLTAVEILSAKPTWNRLVEPVHEDIEASKERLYANMDIEGIDDVVRWDVAATLLDRIDVPYLVGGQRDGSSFERYLTAGFKLYSGYHAGAIAKDNLEQLGGRDDINWGERNFEARIEEIDRALGRIGLISFWKSWGPALADAASDAVGMNYLLVLLRDWDRKGRPKAGGQRDAFDKNAKILFDRMIYEYVVGRWRGSGDSRVARNLAQVAEGPEVFDPVPESEWRQLIEEMVDDGTIEGESYVRTKSVPGTVKLLLYYYYCLSGIQGPTGDIDLDHIIPQRQFASLTADQQVTLKPMMNNIVNLALLPKTDNVAKSDRTLCEIEQAFTDTDDREWMMSQIEAYAEISRAHFERYCHASDTPELVANRGSLIKSVFTDKRPAMLGID